MISFILSILSIVGCTVLSLALSILTSYLIIKFLESDLSHETGMGSFFLGGFVFTIISLIIWNVIIFKLFLL